jgi:hypothetical protein
MIVSFQATCPDLCALPSACSWLQAMLNIATCTREKDLCGRPGSFDASPNTSQTALTPRPPAWVAGGALSRCLGYCPDSCQQWNEPLACRLALPTLPAEIPDTSRAGTQSNGVMNRIKLQDGDTDVASSVATTAGRDAMLRRTVQECLRAAGSNRRVTSLPAQELVCGLSRCLGVPEKRTVTIVHAAVAAELRAVLLGVAAGRRGAGEERVAAEVARLLRIVEVFPMPDDAPEAALVGSALRDKFTMEEMESLLKGLVRLLRRVCACYNAGRFGQGQQGRSL